MSRKPCRFRQRDVTAALKGAVAAGLEVQGVKVSKEGEIFVVTTTSATKQNALSDFDQWKERHADEA